MLSFSTSVSEETLVCTTEVSPKINMIPVTSMRQRCKAFEAASEDEIRENKVPQKLELHQNGDVPFPISIFPFLRSYFL